MEDEDGPLLRRQAPEAAVEGIAQDDVQGRVARGRSVDRQRPNIHAPAPRLPRFRVAGVDEDAVQPGVEALDLAEPREFPPGRDEGLLYGVLGPIDIAQDPMRDGVEPIRASTRVRSTLSLRSDGAPSGRFDHYECARRPMVRYSPPQSPRLPG